MLILIFLDFAGIRRGVTQRQEAQKNHLSEKRISSKSIVYSHWSDELMCDPTWAPTHYLRRLLSLSGRHIVDFLGFAAVEIWIMRGVARTFRYGVAFAYEQAMCQGPLPRRGGAGPVYDIADAALLLTPEGVQLGQVAEEANQSVHGGFEGSNASNGGQTDSVGTESMEDDADDPTIDEVRHVPPQPGDAGVFGVGVAELAMHLVHPPSESSYPDTTTADVSSLEGADSMGDDSHGTPNVSQGAMERSTNPEGVAYRAVDGGLLVVCGAREFFVSLEGWSMEEIGSIVTSIQVGEWSTFYEMISGSVPSQELRTQPISSENRGLPEGSVSYGSDQMAPAISTAGLGESPGIDDSMGLALESEEEEIPPLEPLLPHEPAIEHENLGAALWIFVVVLLAVGSLSLIRAFSVLGLAW